MFTIFSPRKCGVVIMNFEDYWLIGGRISEPSTSGYPRVCLFGDKVELLHRFIMGNPDGLVDHINRNKLDCRRKNLRVISKSLNGINRASSKGRFKGVILEKRKNLFRACLTVNKKRYELGLYKDDIDAAQIVNAAVIKHLGYDYYLNKTENDYSFFTPIPRFFQLDKLSSMVSPESGNVEI